MVLARFGVASADVAPSSASSDGARERIQEGKYDLAGSAVSRRTSCRKQHRCSAA